MIYNSEKRLFFAGYKATFKGWTVKSKKPTWTKQYLNACEFEDKEDAIAECRAMKIPIGWAIAKSVAHKNYLALPD